MEKAEQRAFVLSVLDSAEKGLLEKIDRIPANWDGVELRQWIVDSISEQIIWKKMDKGRRADYDNDVMVNNL